MTETRRRRAVDVPLARRWDARHAAIGVLAALTLGLTACGSDSASDPSLATTTATTVASSPTTTAASTATTTVAASTTVGTDAAPATDPTSETCPEYTDQPDLPLKICDKGDKVTEVQQGLVDAGYDVVVDGFFGNQTRGAVQQFQADNGLEVDGVVGPLTFDKLFPS